MRVLVIGGGGREHALGWKIAQSPRLTELYFAPGNPGTETLGTNVSLENLEEIEKFCTDNHIDLAVVGPEQPLVDGIVDRLQASGISCFGPTAACARLEGSKSFAKEVMAATGVPTADYREFLDFDQALAHVRHHRYPLVVKADGLAAGKGVTVCPDFASAQAALREAMVDNKFGTAGARVVIESFLEGVEASFHVISDGERILPLVTAKDHKAVGEGDRGPNTGGMGTYAPNPRITTDLAETIRERICRPVLRYFRERGTPFRGVLYAGLMLTEDGPKVLEFNVRFGDPETQVMMPLLDFDLLPVLKGAADGRLPSGPHADKGLSSVCVVLAAEGYPGPAANGDAITGLESFENAEVFHAGTKRDPDSGLVTAGGRVLGVTAWAEDRTKARREAYRLVDRIHFRGMHFRRDIGGGIE